MELRSGKRPALVVGTLGIAAILGAGLAAKDRLLEEWYLWKMDSRDFTVRFETAKKLGRLRSERAVPEIITLLKDADGQHNREANQLVDVFQEIGPPAYPPLAKALEDSNGERKYWRRCAFRALKETRGKETIQPLIDRLDDGYLCVRLAAFYTIGEMGPEAKDAIPTLTKSLQDQNHNVRSAAKRALEKIQGKSR